MEVSKGNFDKKNSKLLNFSRTWLLQSSGQDILEALCWARKGKALVLTFKVLQLPRAGAALPWEQSWALSPGQRQQDSSHGQKALHPCLWNKRHDLVQA